MAFGVRFLSHHVPRYCVGNEKPFGFFHRHGDNGRAHNTVAEVLPTPLRAFKEAIAGLERGGLAQGNPALFGDCDCCSGHIGHVLSGIGLGSCPLFYDTSIPHLSLKVNEYFVNNKLFFINKLKDLIINIVLILKQSVPYFKLNKSFTILKVNLMLTTKWSTLCRLNKKFTKFLKINFEIY